MPKPAETLCSVVTYLEMVAKPTAPNLPLPAPKIVLVRAEQPTLSFYRYLFNTIGEDCLWFSRRFMDDDALTNIIQHELVEVYVLYVGGVPGGLGELDRRTEGQIELSFFGLIPEFVGRGLGKYFLRWLVDQAWTYEPERLWLHTCDLDHPNALSVYQKVGFTPYKRETESFKNPQTEGHFPKWVDRRPS